MDISKQEYYQGSVEILPKVYQRVFVFRGCSGVAVAMLPILTQVTMTIAITTAPTANTITTTSSSDNHSTFIIVKKSSAS